MKKLIFCNFFMYELQNGSKMTLRPKNSQENYGLFPLFVTPLTHLNLPRHIFFTPPNTRVLLVGQVSQPMLCYYHHRVTDWTQILWG